MEHTVGTGARTSLGELLRERAEAHPDRPFLTALDSGAELSYGAFDARVNAVARGLAGLGVGRGDFVNVMLPNSAEHLVVAYAIQRLGAVYVAINAEFRAAALARMLDVSGATVLVATETLLAEVERVAGQLTATRTIVVTDRSPARERVAGLPVLPLAAVEAADGESPAAPVSDLDPATVIFTSGSTGISKGCVIPHRQVLRSGECIREACSITAEDCVFTAYPLFHMRAAHLDVLPALISGGRVVLAPRFSASAFWRQMRDHEVTVFSILGTVMQILWQRDPVPEEREHRVRLTWGGPIPIAPERFRERFGVDVLPGEGVYGMSEVGMISMSSFDAERSGRVRPTHDVVVADDDDEPLAPGEVGEILVRPREPGVVFSGYVGMPEATLGTLRSLWFHTGDLGTLDADGRLVFVGRKKDMIRRAGHNISTWEVEEVVDQLEAVAESAALGLPSDLGEEDVVVCVVLRAAAELTAEALLAHCRANMAPFMVPQRIEFVDEIPKTANGKPAKAKLRESLAA